MSCVVYIAVVVDLNWLYSVSASACAGVYEVFYRCLIMQKSMTDIHTYMYIHTYKRGRQCCRIRCLTLRHSASVLEQLSYVLSILRCLKLIMWIMWGMVLVETCPLYWVTVYHVGPRDVSHWGSCVSPFIHDFALCVCGVHMQWSSDLHVPHPVRHIQFCGYLVWWALSTVGLHLATQWWDTHEHTQQKWSVNKDLCCVSCTCMCNLIYSHVYTITTLPGHVAHGTGQNSCNGYFHITIVYNKLGSAT